MNTGFATERLLTMQLSVGGKSMQAVEQSLERIRAIPGVRAAAVTSQLPVTGRGVGAWFNIVDRPTPPNETPPAEAYRVVVAELLRDGGDPARARPIPDPRRSRGPRAGGRSEPGVGEEVLA